jgi:hypothetical protein
MDRPNPRTLTDSQLASFLGNRQDLICFFRAFIRYLSEQVPDAVDGNTEQVSIAQETADNASAVSQLAQALAGEALRLAQDLNEGPPVVALPAVASPDDLTHILGAMSAEIHALTQRVSALEERPTP